MDATHKPATHWSLGSPVSAGREKWENWNSQQSEAASVILVAIWVKTGRAVPLMVYYASSSARINWKEDFGWEVIHPRNVSPRTPFTPHNDPSMLTLTSHPSRPKEMMKYLDSWCFLFFFSFFDLWLCFWVSVGVKLESGDPICDYILLLSLCFSLARPKLQSCIIKWFQYCSLAAHYYQFVSFLFWYFPHRVTMYNSASRVFMNVCAYEYNKRPTGESTKS